MSKQEKQPNAQDLEKGLLLLAKLMDNQFRIPGTQLRFGLDPIIGLIPGIGDALTSLLSSTLLFRGMKAGIPKVVQMRMALNIFLNTALGVIPVFGDLFSFWFKSNMRNIELLQAHSASQETAKKSTLGSWLLLTSLILGVMLFIAGCFFFLWWGWSQITGG